MLYKKNIPNCGSAIFTGADEVIEIVMPNKYPILLGRNYSVFLGMAAFAKYLASVVGIFPRFAPGKINLVVDLKNNSSGLTARASDADAIIEANYVIAKLSPFPAAIKIHTACLEYRTPRISKVYHAHASFCSES
jgi:hypothetical protein